LYDGSANPMNFNLHELINVVPESKIWRDWKFVRCAAVTGKLWRGLVYSRHLKFTQSVDCAYRIYNFPKLNRRWNEHSI